MGTATIVAFVLAPIVLWVVVHWLNRRHTRRTEAKLDQCECSQVMKRATKMHAAVDSKIRAMDSRNPDEPLHGSPPPEAPPTVETPKLILPDDIRHESQPLPPDHDSNRGATRISVVLAVFLFVGTLVGGWMMGTRNQVDDRRQYAVDKAVNIDSKPLENKRSTTDAKFDERLAELRADPKAAVYFKYCSVQPARRAEVIEALQVAARSDNPSDAAVAQRAIMRWEN